jgi:hypothetical protein
MDCQTGWGVVLLLYCKGGWGCKSRKIQIRCLDSQHPVLDDNKFWYVCVTSIEDQDSCWWTRVWVIKNRLPPYLSSFTLDANHPSFKHLSQKANHNFTSIMRLTTASTLTILACLTQAQRPSNTSICDYYTAALLKTNNAINQMTLLTLVVNTAVIGNYTQPNVGIHVPGILAKGAYNGTAVDLLPYFSGGLLSINDGSSEGVSQNFLDGGGALPLTLNKPANGTTSAQ